MIKKEILVKNKMGIHARPAALLAQLCGGYASEIMVAKNGVEVNAKSIMGIMMLAAECGSTLVFKIDGTDESAVEAALEDLFETGFAEVY